MKEENSHQRPVDKVAAVRYFVDEELRKLEAYYEDLYEYAPLAYFTLDREGRIRDLNQRVVELLGYGMEELAGRSFFELGAEKPAGGGEAREILRRFLAGEEIRGEELELRRADGRSLWVALTLRPIRNAGGELVAARSMAVDITARRRAEESLEESRARFAAMVELAPDAIISVDEEQRIILFNKGAEEIFGYAAAEAVGQPLDLLLPESFRAAHRGHVEDFGRSCAPARYMEARREISGRRKSGEVFPAQASVSQLEVGGRKIFTAILRDISAQERTRERLAWLASFPEQNPDPVLELDFEGRVRYLNPAAAKQFPDLGAAGLEHPLLAELEPFLHRFRAGEEGVFSRRLRVGDGLWEEKIVHLAASPGLRIFAHPVGAAPRKERPSG